MRESIRHLARDGYHARVFRRPGTLRYQVKIEVRLRSGGVIVDRRVVWSRLEPADSPQVSVIDAEAARLYPLVSEFARYLNLGGDPATAARTLNEVTELLRPDASGFVYVGSCRVNVNPEHYFATGSGEYVRISEDVAAAVVTRDAMIEALSGDPMMRLCNRCNQSLVSVGYCPKCGCAESRSDPAAGDLSNGTAADPQTQTVQPDEDTGDSRPNPRRAAGPLSRRPARRRVRP
jgi:hypothetical protein